VLIFKLVGVLRWQPHRRSGLATLTSGSHPLVTPYYCRLGDLLCFYPRDAMLARVIVIATCPSVCPSVRPSRDGIVSKRRKL